MAVTTERRWPGTGSTVWDVARDLIDWAREDPLSAIAVIFAAVFAVGLLQFARWLIIGRLVMRSKERFKDIRHQVRKHMTHVSPARELQEEDERWKGEDEDDRP